MKLSEDTIRVQGNKPDFRESRDWHDCMDADILFPKLSIQLRQKCSLYIGHTKRKLRALMPSIPVTSYKKLAEILTRHGPQRNKPS